MIRNIIFDMDDTIFDFRKAEKIAVKKTLEYLGFEPKEEYLKRYSEINLSQWKLLELGKITREQVKIRRYELLFEKLGVDCAGEKATREYEKFLGIGHFFIDGAQELIERLSKKYRLYIATNGTASVQKSRIKSADIEKYMTEIFISQEIGYEKPGKKFFDYCFLRMPDFKKEETVIVGDSLSSDIKGGKNSGITAIWYNPEFTENSSDILPDYEIHKLEELDKVLEKL